MPADNMDPPGASQSAGAAAAGTKARRPPGPRPAARRLGWPAKLAIAAVLITAFGFLFLRSIRGSRSEPYTIDAADLDGWRVGVVPDSGPNGPLLVLQLPGTLISHLAKQLFSRNMESTSSPVHAGIPLLLRNEFDRFFASRTTPEALAALGAVAGLDSRSVAPRCMAYRRTSDPGMTRALYFLEFDGDAVARFRRQLRATLADGGGAGGFDPEALSPILPVASLDPDFDRWLPIRANPSADCVAALTAK